MFEGRFEYSLDEKNRVSIPAKFREILMRHYDMNLILTNLDRCIAAYPRKEWQSLKERLSQSQIATRDVKLFLRFFYSGVTECPIDRLGRILIPQSLKSFAKIVKDVVIIGMDKRIEIWSKEEWEKLVGEVTSDMDRLAEIVATLNL